MSSKENQVTIAVYNSGFDQYAKVTPIEYKKHHHNLLNWLNNTLSMLSQGATILEVGSGLGREAKYIAQKNFNITVTDGARVFVNHLNSLEIPARLLNILEDPIEGKYDMILANAVLPHFTDDDLLIAISKIHGALNRGGIFAFSVKQGFGESWVNEKFESRRYIRLWQPEDIKAFLKSNKFEVLFLQDNVPGDLPTHTWINITAMKAR